MNTQQYIKVFPDSFAKITEIARKLKFEKPELVYLELISHHTEKFTDVKYYRKIFINKSWKLHKFEYGEIYSSIRSISKALSTNITRVYRFFKDLIKEQLLIPITVGNAIKKYAWSFLVDSHKIKYTTNEKRHIMTPEKNIDKVANSETGKNIVETGEMSKIVNDFNTRKNNLLKKGVKLKQAIRILDVQEKEKEKEILNTCGVPVKRDENSKNSSSDVKTEYPFACGLQNKEGKNSIDKVLKSTISEMFSIPEEKPIPKAYYNKPIERKTRQAEPETPEKTARKKMIETFGYIFGIASFKPFAKFIKAYTETRAIELFFNHGQNSQRSVIINTIAEILPEYEYLIKTKMMEI